MSVNESIQRSTLAARIASRAAAPAAALAVGDAQRCLAQAMAHRGDNPHLIVGHLRQARQILADAIDAWDIQTHTIRKALCYEGPHSARRSVNPMHLSDAIVTETSRHLGGE